MLHLFSVHDMDAGAGRSYQSNQFLFHQQGSLSRRWPADSAGPGSKPLEAFRPSRHRWNNHPNECIRIHPAQIAYSSYPIPIAKQAAH
jgi:hypothetical protein